MKLAGVFNCLEINRLEMSPCLCSTTSSFLAYENGGRMAELLKCFPWKCEAQSWSSESTEEKRVWGHILAAPELGAQRRRDVPGLSGLLVSKTQNKTARPMVSEERHLPPPTRM